MATLADIEQTKTHRGENFPVASWLIGRQHRSTILRFYRFARAADDVADHPTLPEPDKLALLDQLEATLLGRDAVATDAVPLREALAERGLAPRHAQDLLTAFRMDVTKRRYRDWDDLMHYCRYSAMPVGRFVLDVHGESASTWPANDALCAALQVINHVQDCRADYQHLDRVYIPLDAMVRAGTSVDALAADRASPELRTCLDDVLERTDALVRVAEPFSPQINDLRLALEVAVIQNIARTLIGILRRRDPLYERVHLGPLGFAGRAAAGIGEGLARRWRGR
jgi:squalene synthase HpnC